MMNVNLRGVFSCVAGSSPTMIRQKSGAIINIVSLAGKNHSLDGASVFCNQVGPSWLFTLADVGSSEICNIRVVSICPGSVNTSFSDHSKDSEKIIQPQDVADTVLFALTMPARSNVSEIDIRPTIIRINSLQCQYGNF